mmetsp:Transcript_39224/g.79971  ORF Transcript_39224/g.79971 Transcript_39224/m.79971 type:complete len:308 (-) Transcript_39224:52-975(-)
MGGQAEGGIWPRWRSDGSDGGDPDARFDPLSSTKGFILSLASLEWIMTELVKATEAVKERAMNEAEGGPAASLSSLPAPGAATTATDNFDNSTSTFAGGTASNFVPNDPSFPRDVERALSDAFRTDPACVPPHIVGLLRKTSLVLEVLRLVDLFPLFCPIVVCPVVHHGAHLGSPRLALLLKATAQRQGADAPPVLCILAGPPAGLALVKHYVVPARSIFPPSNCIRAEGRLVGGLHVQHLKRLWGGGGGLDVECDVGVADAGGGGGGDGRRIGRLQGGTSNFQVDQHRHECRREMGGPIAGGGSAA